MKQITFKIIFTAIVFSSAFYYGCKQKSKETVTATDSIAVNSIDTSASAIKVDSAQIKVINIINKK